MNQFPAEYFRRHDNSSDDYFYSTPRKVVHIDAGAIAQLSAYYAQHLPANSVLLDLMSSWRSHLPTGMPFSRVYGLGMNAAEMRDNPQLDQFIVHNLNEEPALPYETQQFDAVTCAVSVQYLTRPLEVFGEVNRVLKPGGRFIVAFSNRCFPSKAVAVWLSMTDRQHIALVATYFEQAGAWYNQQTDVYTPPRMGDPLYIVSAQKA